MDQYNNYQVLPGVFVSGNVSLPDNIADIGGIKLARMAYQRWVKTNGEEFGDHTFIDKFNNDQLYWIVNAQTWCTQYSEGMLKEIASSDHAPAMCRVNVPMRDFPGFAQDWNCPIGSPMNPPNRCPLW